MFHFLFDYDHETGYTINTIKVDKDEIYETKNKIYIRIYGRLEE